jgi:hypothetical protein
LKSKLSQSDESSEKFDYGTLSRPVHCLATRHLMIISSGSRLEVMHACTPAQLLCLKPMQSAAHDQALDTYFEIYEPRLVQFMAVNHQSRAAASAVALKSHDAGCCMRASSL